MLVNFNLKQGVHMEMTAAEFEDSIVRFLYKTAEDGEKLEIKGTPHDLQATQDAGIDTLLFFQQALFEMKREDGTEAPLTDEEENDWKDSLHFVNELRAKRYIDNISIDKLHSLLVLMQDGAVNSNQLEELKAIYRIFANLIEDGNFWGGVSSSRITNLRAFSESTCIDCKQANPYTVVDKVDTDAVTLRIYCESMEKALPEIVTLCSKKRLLQNNC